MQEDAQALNLNPFLISCIVYISSSSCCSLSTVLLLAHTFNKSDMSDLWKQWNCPLWTLFQHRQGGWSPLHVSLRRLWCVWQMKKHICRRICPEGQRLSLTWRLFLCPFFHHRRNTKVFIRAQRGVVNDFYTWRLTFLMNQCLHCSNQR